MKAEVIKTEKDIEGKGLGRFREEILKVKPPLMVMVHKDSVVRFQLSGSKWEVWQVCELFREGLYRLSREYPELNG